MCGGAAYGKTEGGVARRTMGKPAKLDAAMYDSRLMQQQSGLMH